MSFENKTWYNKDENGNIPDGAPRFDADNMNRIEKGIDDTVKQVNDLGISKIVWGTYTGDGNESQFIDLGFTPSFVLSAKSDGATYLHYDGDYAPYYYYGGITLESSPCRATEIVADGFNAYYQSIDTGQDIYIRANQQNVTYYYIAGQR